MTRPLGRVCAVCGKHSERGALAAYNTAVAWLRNDGYPLSRKAGSRTRPASARR